MGCYFNRKFRKHVSYGQHQNLDDDKGGTQKLQALRSPLCTLCTSLPATGTATSAKRTLCKRPPPIGLSVEHICACTHAHTELGSCGHLASRPLLSASCVDVCRSFFVPFFQSAVYFEAMLSETSALGKYRLCPNWTVKGVYFLGLVLQATTLALAIAMLSLGGWIWVKIDTPPTINSRFELSRIEGLLQDCYGRLGDGSEPLISGGHFVTVDQCYMKDFGQYLSSNYTAHQRAISVAGVTLIALALLGSSLDLVTGLHLAFIWFQAPYDSFYIRAYRLLVGFIAAVTSCLFFASMITFHVGLRLSVQRIPYDKLTSTALNPTNGYYVAWACIGVSVLAAWVILSSTCLWALDYVNCRSLAAAFHPTCAQRASTLSMTNGIRNSIYSLTDGVWSVQDPPTLPRYYTSTYGDGSEIRSKTAEPKAGAETETKNENKGTERRKKETEA
ncbi:hypothetical protein TcWFU_010247 [Taenia crassiceps]|uniref:Uncharacterized protein n=1 Tax=Taenia crassiceps TaxID=6207 RepID=A0ABR4Q181_9CEST